MTLLTLFLPLDPDFLNGFQWCECVAEEFFPPPFEFERVDPLVTLLAGDELSSSDGDMVDSDGIAPLTPEQTKMLTNRKQY